MYDEINLIFEPFDFEAYEGRSGSPCLLNSLQDFLDLVIRQNSLDVTESVKGMVAKAEKYAEELSNSKDVQQIIETFHTQMDANTKFVRIVIISTDAFSQMIGIFTMEDYTINVIKEIESFCEKEQYEFLASSAKALKEKLYLEYSRGSVPIFLRDVQNHQLVYYGIVFGKKKT
ncbi:MAG: hypothetical protein H6620_09225 [Halobacteriovoraceae bacterium]|nr:hypothetical protein [Halobacteriovoraceae bacterium]